MNRVLLMGSLVALLVGCQDKSNSGAAVAAPSEAKTAKPAMPTSPTAAASPAQMEAKTIYQQRCTTCHGPQGMGDGPAATALNPKPRSFADAEWQKTITDDHIRTIIVKGGPAAGKSPMMPPNPDLEQKPEMVTELVKLVRSYAK